MEARKKCSHVQEDRLSNLPEHVLHHILSFLDMKRVIPTCLLSRRWRNLWCSLPFLSFSERVFRWWRWWHLGTSENYRSQNFAFFVNTVLLRRDTSPIQSFDLIWGTNDEDDDEDTYDESWKSDYIDQWIRAAVLQNVKVINIQVESSYPPFKFPDCFFTFKSLTSLKLELLHESSGEYGLMKVKLAAKISLPSLKTLHLESLDLSEYDDLFDILFLGCPVLETLFLIGCEFSVSKVLTISSVHLKHLHIDMTGDEEVFVIRASNLLDYFWSGSWCAFSLDGLSSLETANIDPGASLRIRSSIDSKDLKMSVTGAVNGMMECLKGLYNVKHLTLSNACLQLISELPSELEKWPAPFNNLIYLNLQTLLTRGCFEVTMFLLKNSPNIQTLVLHMYPIESEKKAVHRIESSVDLKLHRLKLVELRQASGCKNELQHLKILLGNAEALEKVTVVESRYLGNNAKKWKDFTAEVLTLPRVSPDVTINFRTAKKMDSYQCKSVNF